MKLKGPKDFEDGRNRIRWGWRAYWANIRHPYKGNQIQYVGSGIYLSTEWTDLQEKYGLPNINKNEWQPLISLANHPWFRQA